MALEGDKELLQLQFQQMSDRIHSQNTKVTDLQRNLERKNVDLRKTEDELHHEVMSRSYLETRKLELMSEISGLKLRHTEMEAENSELRRKLAEVGQPGVTGFRPVYGSPDPRHSGKQTFTDKESTPVRGATNFFVRSGAFKSPISAPGGGTRCRSPGLLGEAGQPGPGAPIVKKSRGLKKLWSRMRRSHSIHIPQEDQSAADKTRFSVGSISCESLGKLSF